MLQCATCLLPFQTVLDLREHHKTEVHILNLRLSLKGLPPLSIDRFNELKGQHIQQKDLGVNTPQLTDPNSETHNKNLGGFDKPSSETHNKNLEGFEDTPKKIDKDISILECLFDDQTFLTFEECLNYMEQTYSFSIPDRNFLIDINHLMISLGSLIHHFNVCIYCKKRFSSTQGVRDHMIRKGHTTLPKSSDFEYHFGDFYNYDLNENDKTENDNSISPDFEVSKDEELSEYESLSDGEISESEFDKNFEKYLKNRFEKFPISDFGLLQLPSGKQVSSRYLAYIFKQGNPSMPNAAITDKNNTQPKHTQIRKQIERGTHPHTPQAFQELKKQKKREKYTQSKIDKVQDSLPKPNSPYKVSL